MKDLTQHTDDTLSLVVFNDKYYYNERNHGGDNDYILALVAEEFIYTGCQLEILITNLNDDRAES